VTFISEKMSVDHVSLNWQTEKVSTNRIGIYFEKAYLPKTGKVIREICACLPKGLAQVEEKSERR
jgi:hypothetical protein